MESCNDQREVSFVEVFLFSQVFLGMAIIFGISLFSYETIQPLNLLLGGEDPTHKLDNILIGFSICFKLIFFLGGLVSSIVAISLWSKRKNDKSISCSQITVVGFGSLSFFIAFIVSYFSF